jgi:hypothetical protein
VNRNAAAHRRRRRRPRALVGLRVANGFRCPLTDLAESFGAAHGSVTDLYLPPWFARNMPAIHVPLLLLAARSVSTESPPARNAGRADLGGDHHPRPPRAVMW